MKTKSIWRFLPPITLTAVLIVSSAVRAAEAPPSIQWQKSFGGSEDDELAAIQPTSDGGYILVGGSESGVSGNKTSTNYGGYVPVIALGNEWPFQPCVWPMRL
jgi:hypothetical protein